AFLVEKTDELFITNIKTFGNDKDLFMRNLEKISMQGKNVYRFAVDKVPESIKEILIKSNLSNKEIDHVFCHQANIRIIKKISQKTNIDISRFHINLNEYGNTSAASIPILVNSVSKTKIKRGEIILLTAFGAGLTVGSIIMKW
ncbi:MAG: 3-oxoacyl-[acyl-carrier-protein] synthase III C-terminal domain-containing protein, partial [Tissierellia bacterium]|nr:3-oxoacyl-[acyl-carrier-protein] synthase III C-terminal domain-containing protein [Tissierellia bacterium]